MKMKPYANKRSLITTTAKQPRLRPLINKVASLDDVLDGCDLKDGMIVSFHHHFRNGDVLVNKMMHALAARHIKDITLVASSLFDVHAPLIPLIKDGTITQIITGYMSRQLGEVVSRGYLKKGIIMHSHGYRSLMLNHHLVHVDVAFIGASASDMVGNASGSEGQSLCGSLGYAISDATSAKRVIVLTDTILETIKAPQIKGEWVDHVVMVDQVGDVEGIVSGTTNITRDPIGLLIAKQAIALCEAAELIKEGMSFQGGAGGISLAATQMMADYLKAHHMQARFVSGGTTKISVEMLNLGLTQSLMDVQCFDLQAIASLGNHVHHHAMSAYDYADISNKDNIADQLDVVFLGATEIDLNFNVNVTTTSDGIIMGGSGGHCDVANGAQFTIIVSKLMQSRLSVIVKEVLTISTPSEDVDALVTEFGIALHPRHEHLIEKLKSTTTLPIMSIKQLYELAMSLTGIPKAISMSDEVIGVSLYRDGTLLDKLYKIK